VKKVTSPTKEKSEQKEAIPDKAPAPSPAGRKSASAKPKSTEQEAKSPTAERTNKETKDHKQQALKHTMLAEIAATHAKTPKEAAEKAKVSHTKTDVLSQLKNKPELQRPSTPSGTKTIQPLHAHKHVQQLKHTIKIKEQALKPVLESLPPADELKDPVPRQHLKRKNEESKDQESPSTTSPTNKRQKWLLKTEIKKDAVNREIERYGSQVKQVLNKRSHRH
jgi:hypothetical protein